MTKKILTAALALAISFALWLYVVMVIGPEYQDTFRNVKVEFVGETALAEKGLMILQTENPTVDLELSGNRRDLNKLSASNISVTLDLSQIEKAEKREYRYDVTYPGNVAKNAVTVQNQNPSGIFLEVVERGSKPIPVNVEFDEEAIAQGYGPLQEIVELSELQIVGPADVVNQITQAYIRVDITEENNKADITGEYVATLCNSNGEEVDSKYVTVTTEGAEKIGVTLPIRMKKVLPLTVEILEGGGATADNTTYTVSPSTVTVLGSEDALKDLEEISLGQIDLGKLEPGAEPIVLPIVLPDGVTNKSGVEGATVTVTLPELVKKEFIISKEQFQTTGIPAGTYPDISAEQMTVTVRGTKNAVAALTPEMIQIAIDFTDAKEGQMKDWTVQVTIAGEPDNVGIIGGPYTVWVEILDEAEAAALLQEPTT